MGWFSICPGFSCYKIGDDDFQALYISKLRLEVKVSVSKMNLALLNIKKNDHVRGDGFVRMNFSHSLAQDAMCH